MILCLSLGANVEAAVVKSTANKPKDIKSIKVNKVINATSDKNLKDITLDEFFKKLANKKEEELIKKIVVNSEPDNISVFKQKNAEYYVLMFDKNISATGEFTSSKIFFIYDFRKGDLVKTISLVNYLDLLDTLTINNANNLFDDVVTLINNKELDSKLIPYLVYCSDAISGNIDQIALDRTLGNSKKYYFHYEMAANNEAAIASNVSTKRGKLEYSVTITRNVFK
jgi:hypothetical protein